MRFSLWLRYITRRTFRMPFKLSAATIAKLPKANHNLVDPQLDRIMKVFSHADFCADTKKLVEAVIGKKLPDENYGVVRHGNWVIYGKNDESIPVDQPVLIVEFENEDTIAVFFFSAENNTIYCADAIFDYEEGEEGEPRLATQEEVDKELIRWTHALIGKSFLSYLDQEKLVDTIV